MRAATSTNNEEGSDPTVICVPGSWGTWSAWRGVIVALGGRFRIVTTSLLGYGGTTERRTAADFSIERGGRNHRGSQRRGGGRVHLVGHSYGGQVCLLLQSAGTPLGMVRFGRPTANEQAAKAALPSPVTTHAFGLRLAHIFPSGSLISQGLSMRLKS
jgi:thioesterase domain-containing protein